MSSERVAPGVKKIVSSRAKNYCEYCQTPDKYCTGSFTIDHIKPREAGGENTLDNLAWACLGCNSHKHIKTQDKDPETGEDVPLFNPRQQVWSDHFTWSNDFTGVIGKTACGRATIQALHLNREGLINLRGLLIMAGIHPPL